jgi:putative sigma-54 modulation protein
MNIAVTFRHMNATEAVKGYATDKISRMQRFLRAPMKSQVTLSCQHDRLHTVEVEIHSGGNHFHAHETSEDMYASIDKVLDKIERQIVSAKEALTGRKKGGERASQHLLPDSGNDE